MFGRMGQLLHRNVIIGLAIVVAMLLAAGTALAVTTPEAGAAPAPLSARPGTVHSTVHSTVHRG